MRIETVLLLTMAGYFFVAAVIPQVRPKRLKWRLIATALVRPHRAAEYASIRNEGPRMGGLTCLGFGVLFGGVSTLCADPPSAASLYLLPMGFVLLAVGTFLDWLSGPPANPKRQNEN